MGILCQKICVMPIRFRTLKKEYALLNSDLASILYYVIFVCMYLFYNWCNLLYKCLYIFYD